METRSDDEREKMDILSRGARELHIPLTEAQLAQFARFQSELLDWNERMNLTAITEPTDIQIKHFLDSLTVVAALPAERRSGARRRLLDVGAGAGFPGIPLAIVLPNVDIVLLEATQKKCRFLEHAIASLGLPNVQVACGRAEDLGRAAGERESYDVVVARAVASLAALAELCLPFARIGGRVIAQKKLGIADEVSSAARAIKTVGGKMVSPVTVHLPISGEARQLVIIEKVSPTPSLYPRRPGLPAKSPLG